MGGRRRLGGLHSNDYYLNPEDIAYGQSIERFQNQYNYIMDLVYMVSLPIPVQTKMNIVTAHGCSFARVKTG